MNSWESGIIVYDPSDLGTDFTVAKAFRSTKKFNVSTTVVFSDRSEKQILNRLIKGIVFFPSGSVTSADLEATANEIKRISDAYPLTLNLMSVHESLLRERAKKLRSSEELRAKKLRRSEELRAHQSKQIGRTVSFSDSSGQEYKDVELKAVEPDGITIEVSGEDLKLLFVNLPVEIQNFLGYDPGMAADYAEAVKKRKEEEERRAAAQAAMMEARRKEKEAMAAAQAEQAEQEMLIRKEQERIRPIIEIETDLSGFAGRIVSIQGAISLDTYFNYEYDELGHSHFCFKVRDEDYNTAYVYAPKSSEIGQSLRQELLNAGGSLNGRITLMIPRARLGEFQNQLLANLEGYGPPK